MNRRKPLCVAVALLAVASPVCAQPLTIDDCRRLASENNRQLAVSRVRQDVAENVRRAARTKYLPRITALAGYELTSREISILSQSQQGALNTMGTTAVTAFGNIAGQEIGAMVEGGMLSPEAAQMLQQRLGQLSGTAAEAGNAVGQTITDAFHTDTRQMFGGAIMLTQPVYMGGAITAANRMADIGERMAKAQLAQTEHETRYDTDRTYWLVVSLSHKRELAARFNRLVARLDSDVRKMIREGVATKADGLKVAVSLNESEMTLTEAENGIALARMLLCRQCGLPLDSAVTLADEQSATLPKAEPLTTGDTKTAIDRRPETQTLAEAVALTREATRMARASYLPQVMLTGGYLISNPNVFDSFHRSFAGVWNVGIMARVPVWSWFEGAYRVRATKAATTMARYELADARDKMTLEISQSRFKAQEADKRLAMAEKNITSAEENMRCADLGFREGVISSTDVIAAQTAWYKAESQRIDAEIEVRMARLALRKAMGALE